MAATVDSILSTIQRLLAELDDVALPLADVAATRWDAIGLGSLAMAELVVYIEQYYNCTIPNEALSTVVTFGDLAHLITDRTGKGA